MQQDDEIVQNEIFGPVITVQTFADEAEALRAGQRHPVRAGVERVDHGPLAGAPAVAGAGVRLRVGQRHIPLVAEMPHGGFKECGYGKDLSGYSLEDYTRVKHVMSKYA